jgi:hypothetical protein
MLQTLRFFGKDLHSTKYVEYRLLIDMPICELTAE